MGPFHLGTRLQVPVLFVYVMREPKRHYHLYARRVDVKYNDPQDLLEKYTENVQRVLKKYPLQWFNFYDFWEDGTFKKMLKFKNITILAFSLLLVLGAFDIFINVSGIAYLFIGFVWFVLITVGSFSMSWNFFTPAFTSQKVFSEKKVAITFDDGPHPEYTPQVLELLKKYNAKATFFCIGKNIEKHPEILKAIVENGHSIGNHSYSHASRFGFFGRKKIISEIEITDQLLEAVSGKKNKLFRPPYGVTNPSIASAVKQTNHKVIGWSIRPFDTVIKNPKTVLKSITKKVSPGAIVLLHDSHERIPYVLEHLLLFLENEGYQTVTIETLINKN